MSEPLVELPDVAVLSPRVTRILGQNPGNYTLQGTNTYIVGTGRRRLLIDTGEGKPSYEQLLGTFLRDANVEIERIIITHWHHDHTGGIPQVMKLLGRSVPVHKLPDAEHDDDVTATGVALQAVEDGATLSVEGATLRVMATPGHTDDHMCLHLAEENAVFSGDSVLGQGTTVFENLRKYLKSLQRIADTDCALIYPSHGPHITTGVAKVNEYIAHRMARERQVIDVLASKGASTVQDMVQDIYAGYPTALHAAAAGGLLQHLGKLEEEGRVEYDADNDRWQLFPSKM